MRSFTLVEEVEKISYFREMERCWCLVDLGICVSLKDEASNYENKWHVDL